LDAHLTDAVGGDGAPRVAEPVAEPPVRARRLVDRLGHYWRETARTGRFPALDAIDPWMIGDDWPDCLLVEIQAPLTASRLLAIGEHLLREAQRQPRDYIVAEVPTDSLAGVIIERLPSVLSSREGLVVDGDIAHNSGRMLYRAILLPLAADGATIDHVLAAVSCKFIARRFAD
jgi:hypothetical protein